MSACWNRKRPKRLLGEIILSDLARDDELEDTIARIQASAEPFPAYTPRPLTYTLPAEPAPTDRDLRLFGLGVLMGLCWAGLAYLVFA